MNKILNVNLGGYAFTIDDDAFNYLSAYLESIRKKFQHSEGRDEILSDIEARLGELIHQDLGNRTIVMLPDVEAAVRIMGKPEDFDAEAGESSGPSTHKTSTKSGNAQGMRTGKRIFRDEEDKVVGGVCSGLAAYFGFEDPVWMRLIFVGMAFLSAGFWIPAYILMMILVPPAKTAADRLAMRGEPINADNIAKEIEEGFERFGAKMNEFGEQINEKASKKKGTGVGHEAMSSGMTALGHVFGAMLKFMAKFGIVIAILIGISLFIGLAASWVAGIAGMVAAAPLVGYFSPYSSGTTWFAFANTFFVLGIPVIGLMLTFVRLLFRTRIPTWLGTGLGVFWILNLASLLLLAGLGAKGYRQSGTVSQTIDLSGLPSDTLRVRGVEMYPQGEGEALFFDGDLVNVNDNTLRFKGMVDIRVVRSEEGRFVCRQILSARGRTNREAIENAASTNFNAILEGNVLKVPLGYTIPKGTKWRGQNVRLNVELPVGKYVVFEENIYDRAAADMDLYHDDNDHHYISRRPNKVFQMTKDGLVCVDCDRIGDSQFSTERAYEHFILEGNFNADIRKHDGEGFRYSIEGPKDVVQVIKTGGRITFTNNGKPAETVKIIIEAPVFTSLVADNTGDVTIRGFDEGRASINAKGSARVKAYFDCNDLEVALSGSKCTLELNGRGNDLKANLVDGATLEAPHFRVSDAEVSATDGSRARIYASDNARVSRDGNSTVKVDGGAKEKED